MAKTMTQPTLTYSQFTNQVPFLRIGYGLKTLLFLLGGPGNSLPKGLGATGFLRVMKAFVKDYTIYLASRKSGLPEGYSTKAMANDYAELICTDFGGRVDLIIGFSFGGLILQHFAADHGYLAGHIVIGGAANRISEKARQIDWRFAELISLGRDREAMAQRAGALVPPGLRYGLLYGILWLFGKSLLGPMDETFRRDVLIEAKAEMAHDAWESLGRIEVPLLIICGKTDFAFALEDVEAMAAMIPKSTLKVYDCGHSGLILDKRFPEDVKRFVEIRA